MVNTSQSESHRLVITYVSRKPVITLLRDGYNIRLLAPTCQQWRLENNKYQDPACLQPLFVKTIFFINLIGWMSLC